MLSRNEIMELSWDGGGKASPDEQRSCCSRSPPEMDASAALPELGSGGDEIADMARGDRVDTPVPDVVLGCEREIFSSA